MFQSKNWIQCITVLAIHLCIFFTVWVLKLSVSTSCLTDIAIIYLREKTSQEPLFKEYDKCLSLFAILFY